MSVRSLVRHVRITEHGRLSRSEDNDSLTDVQTGDLIILVANCFSSVSTSLMQVPYLHRNDQSGIGRSLVYASIRLSESFPHITCTTTICLHRVESCFHSLFLVAVIGSTHIFVGWTLLITA